MRSWHAMCSSRSRCKEHQETPRQEQVPGVAGEPLRKAVFPLVQVACKQRQGRMQAVSQTRRDLMSPHTK